MTTPYREPAEIAEEIPKMPIDWAGWAFRAGCLVAMGYIGTCMYRDVTKPLPPPPQCEYYADTPMDRVPARCIQFFHKQEQK